MDIFIKTKDGWVSMRYVVKVARVNTDSLAADVVMGSQITRVSIPLPAQTRAVSEMLMLV
jgi:hypothetical protein